MIDENIKTYLQKLPAYKSFKVFPDKIEIYEFGHLNKIIFTNIKIKSITYKHDN